MWETGETSDSLSGKASECSSFAQQYMLWYPQSIDSGFSTHCDMCKGVHRFKLKPPALITWEKHRICSYVLASKNRGISYCMKYQ